MFETLYELLCGKNDDPTYVTNIFPSVGLFSLIGAVVFAVIFYLLLGRYTHIWYNRKHWIITLIVLLLFAGAFALLNAKSQIGADSFDSFMVIFSLVNSLYVGLYFFVFSLLLKRFSIHAKRTPF